MEVAPAAKEAVGRERPTMYVIAWLGGFCPLAGGWGCESCETALQGARLRLSRAYYGTSRLVATQGMRAALPVRPSTREMLAPPRRVLRACVLASATRRLCIFFRVTAGCRGQRTCVYPPLQVLIV